MFGQAINLEAFADSFLNYFFQCALRMAAELTWRVVAARSMYAAQKSDCDSVYAAPIFIAADARTGMRVKAYHAISWVLTEAQADSIGFLVFRTERKGQLSFLQSEIIYS